jgi:hypothetical protein
MICFPFHVQTKQKERDLELAARIGQSLLDQNRNLKSQNDVLENELSQCRESVSCNPFRHLLLML